MACRGRVEDLGGAVLVKDAGAERAVGSRRACWACLAQHHSAERHGPADDSESTCRQLSIGVQEGEGGAWWDVPCLCGRRQTMLVDDGVGGF